MSTSLPGSALGKSATFPMGWAILLIIVGFFALALPFEAGIAIAVVVAVFVIWPASRISRAALRRAPREGSSGACWWAALI